MRNKQVIFLNPFKDSVAWACLDQAGQVLGSDLAIALSQLAFDKNDEVIAVIPADDVLLTEVKLPKLSRARLQQALPYALEEQVLDELEALHFASGPYQADQRLPVAVIKKAHISHWLQVLQRYGIQPEVMVPSSLALPFKENQWQLACLGNSFTIRTGAYSGFSCEPNNLETLLALKLTEEKKLPEAIICYHEPQQALKISLASVPLQQVELTQLAFLETQAASLVNYPIINILQAAYSPAVKRRTSEKNKKMWQSAGLALLLLIAFTLLTPLGSLLLLSTEHQHFQNEIQRIAKKHRVQDYSDPKAALETQLSKALKESDQRLFLQWLSDIAKTGSAIRIQSLHFQHQKLTLTLTAPSLASVDEFMLSLKGEEVKVTQQSAVQQGSQVRAILIVERESA